MKVDESVFRTYDIRGVYPGQVNEEVAEAIGKAFVTLLKPKGVVVGMDMRSSSKPLFDALAKGITASGANVTSIGMCTTPMLSFSVANYGFDTGVMISASHSPGEYNGFKLIGKNVVQLSTETGIMDVKEIVENENFQAGEVKGKISEKDVLDDYIKHVMKFSEHKCRLKVIADYGNGVGAISAKKIFKELGIEAIHLYAEPDGSFPNHPADTHDVENFKDLQGKVVEEKADFGVFFDGDADRMQVVDEKGSIIFPDFLLGVLAKYELQKQPNQKVYFDLRFSKAVREAIAESKGIPVMLRVGNPFYKRRLIEEGGLMAGEFSGHIMYRENHAIDDAILAVVKFINCLCSSGKSVSETIKPLQKYFPLAEISMKVENPDAVMKKVEKHFSDAKISHLDGITVEYADWWFNMRKSQTESVVRLRLEADNEKLALEKKEEVLKIIKV